MISGTDISEINWGSALISGLTGAALGAVDVLGIGSIAGACIKGGISFVVRLRIMFIKVMILELQLEVQLLMDLHR